MSLIYCHPTVIMRVAWVRLLGLNSVLSLGIYASFSRSVLEESCYLTHVNSSKILVLSPTLQTAFLASVFRVSFFSKNKHCLLFSYPIYFFLSVHVFCPFSNLRLFSFMFYLIISIFTFHPSL